MNEQSDLAIDIGVAMQKLNRQLARVENDFQKAARKQEREFARANDRIAKDFDKLRDSANASLSKIAMPKAMTALGGIGGAFLGGFAVGSVGEIVRSSREVVRSIAEIGNEAQRAGLSAEAFQEWKFVADQNRIGVDALVDGFKELSLRADELIVTGAGPAAEAFARLGYRAEDLKEKLQDPSALMLEILGRLQGFDKAAQIRIADEIFGGTGGERFVELLGQGQGALQATIDKAHETGAVLDAELIAKADEIDRKFSQLTASAATFAKAAVVNLVAAGAELADLRARLDGIFANEAEGRAMIGDELYDALMPDRDLVEQNEASLQRIQERYTTLAEEAGRAGVAMLDAITRLDSLGYDTAADALRVAYEEMQNLVQAFRDGEISGEDFTVKLGEIEAAAVDAFGALEAGDRTTFEGVISQLGRLGGIIASVTSLANSMGAAIARAAGTTPDQKATQTMRDRHAAEAASMDSMEAQREALEGFTAAEEARNSATAEQLALQREIEAVRKRAGEAGATLTDQQANDLAAASLAGAAARSAAGKKGSSKSGKEGKAKPDEFTKEVQAIRDRTAALEAEAAVLVAVAASGKEYGDALEFARKKAELLHAATQAGKEITPELEAQIVKLAEAYVQAGLKAEGAADRLEAIKEQSRLGKDAMTDLFGAIFDHSMSAKEAVGQLLLEIAKIKAIEATMSLPGMGSLSSIVGGLLGRGGGVRGGDLLSNALRGTGAFGGFRATGGPVTAGKTYWTGERGPEPFVPAVNGRILSTAQAQAAVRGDRGRSITFAPSTSIVIQGNADQGSLAQFRRELDIRDQRLRKDMPAIMRKHNLTDG